METGHVDELMAGLERMVHAVAEGQHDPHRLAEGLTAALAETESFARQLEDATFASDEASTAWRQGAAEAAGGVCAGLYAMLRSLHGEEIDRQSLLGALEQTINAERRLRDIYQYAYLHRLAVREAMEAANRIACMRCGHRNMAGRSTCDHCRFPLPQTGVERVESDIVGAQPAIRESVFLERLDLLMERLETEEGRLAVLDFLLNMERLYLLAGRQLDAMLARAPRDHEAVVLTVSLARRMQDVREMAEAVRHAVTAGQLGALDDFRPWLAEQIGIILNLKERVAAACD